MRTGAKVFIGLLVLSGATAGGAYAWLSSGVAPMPSGAPQFVRFERRTTIADAAEQLQTKGVLKNAEAFRIWGVLNKKEPVVPVGTYSVKPGQTADEVFEALTKPISNMFRIPETNLSFRTANLLDKNGIAMKAMYMDLLKEPVIFKDSVDFPLPTDSLEGYLYPDTYDLPPLLGAKEVMIRQLKAFEKKVHPLLPEDPAKRKKILTVASMVELEAGVDQERAKIAGVIENRIKKGMRLEIDATVLYALQEWRRLYYRDYRNTNSPYNTYKIKGLPPGPICSPSVKSVQAALKPQVHPYLYYVAMPNRTHLFAQTYEDHVKNIAVARKARDGTAARPK